MDKVTCRNENLLRNKQVEILDFLKEICSENDIHYFITGGTLLGAIKYKDFIKGDKDIDIGMLREDYTKFIDVVQLNLPPNISLVDSRTEGVNWFYAKLVLNNTYFSNGTENYGVFIDIMPYDYMSTNKIMYNMKFVVSRIVKWIFLYHEKKGDIWIEKLAHIFSNKFSRGKICNVGLRVFKSFKGADIVQNLSCGSKEDYFYVDEVRPEACQQKEFHGKKYTVPTYERYLEKNYCGWETKDIVREELYEYYIDFIG